MWKGKDQTTTYLNFSQIHRGPKKRPNRYKSIIILHNKFPKNLISLKVNKSIEHSDLYPWK